MKIKSFVVCAFAALVAMPVMAKDDTESTGNNLLEGIEWERPENTGVESLDNIYTKGDSLYKHLQELDEGLVFYDVRQIVSEESGDTIVAVVDNNGNIRSSGVALLQYVNSARLTLPVVSDATSIAADATSMVGDLKSIVKLSNPLKSLKTIKSATKALNQIKKMCTVPSKMLSLFNKQKKKIRAYKKSLKGDDIQALSDPALRNIPELELDQTAVITKSDKEIMESVAAMKAEDDKLSEDADLLQELQSED